MTTLFEPVRKNKMALLLHNAKGSKNDYEALLDYLKALFDKNPHHPVMKEAVSYIRLNIWPESARDHFLLKDHINQDTFGLLKTNYHKFKRSKKAEADLLLSPENKNLSQL